MKHFQKIFILIGVAVVFSILDPITTHAQHEEQLTTRAQSEEQHNSQKHDLQIKGEFTLRTLCDFKYGQGKESFAPSAIPMQDDKNEGPQFGLGVLDADLAIEKKLYFVGEEASFFIKTGLAKEKVTLKSIYADHKKFRVGLATSSFCNLDALPETLCDTPCSAAFARVGQAAWKGQINEEFNYTIGIEDPLQPDLYPGIEKQEEKDKQPFLPKKSFPALAGNLRYKKEAFHVQLGGLVRIFDYRKHGKEDDVLPTFGLNLSGEYKFIPEQTTLKAHGLYGMGIGSYIADFSETPKTEPKDCFIKNNEEIVPISTWGGYIGVEHRWVPKWRSTVAAGVLGTSDDQDRDEHAYKQGVYASGNLTFHPTDYFSTGVEYLYGNRSSVGKDSTDRDAHRVQLIAKVSF